MVNGFGETCDPVNPTSRLCNWTRWCVQCLVVSKVDETICCDKAANLVTSCYSKVLRRCSNTFINEFVEQLWEEVVVEVQRRSSKDQKEKSNEKVQWTLQINWETFGNVRPVEDLCEVLTASCGRVFDDEQDRRLTNASADRIDEKRQRAETKKTKKA